MDEFVTLKNFEMVFIQGQTYIALVYFDQCSTDVLDW